MKNKYVLYILIALISMLFGKFILKVMFHATVGLLSLLFNLITIILVILIVYGIYRWVKRFFKN